MQNIAFSHVLAEAESPVGWAYEVWDETVAMLDHRDNHNRAIAAQLLARLAGSDPDRRILADFDRLLQVTRDERFVTARHALQSIWRVGLAGDQQLQAVLDGLSRRFSEALDEKNGSLTRQDISVALRELYDVTADGQVKAAASELIGSEPDPKARKKLAGAWREVVLGDD